VCGNVAVAAACPFAGPFDCAPTERLRTVLRALPFDSAPLERLRTRRRGEVMVDLNRLRRSMAKTAVSLLGGGIFYYFWMSTFLLSYRSASSTTEALLWVLAPIFTAIGFSVGAAILEPQARTGPGFLRLLRWPLAGCAVGAGAVYWLGPMLIVFGMLMAGTLSIALREVVAQTRDGGP
jgi:hypothetical protein